MSRPSQPLEALEHANRIRQYRAKIRDHVRGSRDYRESRHRLAQLFVVTPIPKDLRGVHAIAVLQWGWQMQGRMCERILRAAGASPVARIGHLTFRQRLLIATLLDGDAGTLADAELAEELDMRGIDG